MSALVELTYERYGAPDVLVDNAGVMPVSPLDDLRVEEWEAARTLDQAARGR